MLLSSKLHAQTEKSNAKSRNIVENSGILNLFNDGLSHRLKPTWTADAPYMIRTTDKMIPCQAHDLQEYGSSWWVLVVLYVEPKMKVTTKKPKP